MTAHTGALAVRWTARFLSVVSIGLLLLFVVGEGFNPLQLTPREWLLFAFFPIGICIGMVLAWRWEGLGGLVTILGLVGFYLAHAFSSGSLPRGWAFALFALPGLLFLFSWASRRDAVA